MCRGWQVALPKVMLCARLVVDCRQRMRRKQLERDLAEAVTEELAEIIALIRSSEHTTPQKTIELGGLGLSAEEWEAPPVVRSKPLARPSVWGWRRRRPRASGRPATA